MREMKDSGIEWIDEIPLDWTVKPLKWIVKFGKGLPITKDNLIEQGVPVVSYGQIHSKTNNGTHLKDDLIRFVSEAYLESNPLSLGKKGDIFFADTSEDYAGIGNAVLVDIDIPVFAGYHTVIVRPDDESYSRYLAYLFLTDAWRTQLCSGASGIKVFSITQGLLKKTTVILPPVEKTVAMTDYLDRKCSQIDAIIARQQEVIEKLKAYKLSVITEAVTKGLNPDVPMKDSGVEWIGEIPEHWKVAKLKFVASFYNGDRSSKYPSGTDIVDEGVIFVTSNNLGNTFLDTTISTKYITKEKYNDLGGAKIRINDIIFCLRGSVGKCSINKSENEGTIASSLVVIRAKKILADYLIFALQCPGITAVSTLNAIGIGSLNLSADDISEINIPIPPEKEAAEIAEFLYKRIGETDHVINERNNYINHFIIYKKSLIYEVVTGKKEVI